MKSEDGTRWLKLSLIGNPHQVGLHFCTYFISKEWLINTVVILTEYEYVTHYDIHVSTPTSLRNSDCPDYTSPVQFVAPKVCSYATIELYW